MVLVLLPTIANATFSKKFDFLVRFYDLNEAAFAYHRHCMSTEKPINPAFLKVLEFVADELLAESIRDNPKRSPDYIKTKILERRYNIQYQLDRENIKNGCSSAASLRAKEHYQKFRTYNKAEVRKFIDEQTNG